jgi:small subunit ribosomal protein S1
VPETETLTQPKTVEGSGGLLLEIDGQIVPNYDATIVPFDEGDVVSGRVVQIDQDEVLVDIGYKSEGVIPMNELSIRKSVDPHDEVEMGEEVDALVLTKEDQDGRLLLSKKRARFEKAWRKIEAAAESGEPVEGTVIEVVKGGLIIDLGVRGFLPASLVDIRRVQNLDEFLGTKIECKVIELNRSRNNVVLSRRAVLEEERKEVRQQILDRLQPGMIVEGAISNIVDFGAFVDLDGIDGLIHISELSWSHVNHPSEILAIGDVVPVKVLDIDRDRQRISLGLKQTQEDPWQRVIDTYRVGDELEGKVTKVVTFGAFVEIMDGVEGLVHISELAHHHVENPREILEPGQDVRVKVLEIDSERRRLSLSVKRVAEQLPHIKSAAAAGAAAAGVSEDIGDVPDLGLSEDVFAGPQVSGVDHLRAAMSFDTPAEEAPPLAEEGGPVDEAAAPAASPDEAAAAADEAAPAPADEASAAPADEAAPAPADEAAPAPAPADEASAAPADEAAAAEAPPAAPADEASAAPPADEAAPAAPADEAAPADPASGDPTADATAAATDDESASAGDEPTSSDDEPDAPSEQPPE